MLIFAKTMCGKTVSFEVQRTERIIDIKKKIQEKIGLSPGEQKLVYQDKILEDDERTVNDYQITERSVIDVVAQLRGLMQLFARTMDGKTVAFEVQRTERIIDIKKKIQEKIGLQPGEQKLVYQGSMLDDERTVDEYGICEKSVINVVARLRGFMQLFAKTMDGKTVAFEVQKTERIIDIKTRIYEKIGLSPDKQILFYQGGILEDDDKTVDEYGICEKFVINVLARLRLLLVVKTVHGTTIALEAQKTDKIIDIKKKIQEKLGLQNEKSLIYQDEILDNNKRIDEYQIFDKSVINVDA